MMSARTRAAETVRARTSSAGDHVVGSVEIRMYAVRSMISSTGTEFPSFWRARKTQWITYTDILRTLEPINEGCDKRDRVTYDSLWGPRQASLRPCRDSGLLDSLDG